MSEPSQIYHTSGRPPLFYYQGYEIIGGSISYDRTIAIATPGYLDIGDNSKNEITDLVGTIDIS